MLWILGFLFLYLLADLALEPISVLFERLEEETFAKVWTEDSLL